MLTLKFLCDTISHVAERRDLKTVCPQGRVGSNPTLSALEKELLFEQNFGEVPKLAEGAPLERE